MNSKTFPLILSVIFMILSCGPKKFDLDPKKNSDKQIYEAGVEYLKKGDNAQAREAFKTVFENFPKSDYRILAKIAYADSYYKEGTDANYLLAINEYQDFISLFPFSPKAEYAQVQIGMCYYHMMEKPDRDQTNTKKALEEFKKGTENYPKGSYYRSAYNRMMDCYSRLAEHDFLIARFYYRTSKYQASVDRLKDLLKTYPSAIYQPKYYYFLASALEKSNQSKESCSYFATLLEKWPTSEFTKDARSSQAKICHGS